MARRFRMIDGDAGPGDVHSHARLHRFVCPLLRGEVYAGVAVGLIAAGAGLLVRWSDGRR